MTNHTPPPFTIDPDLNEIHIGGEIRRVSPQLMRLLQLFMAHEGRVLTRSKILDRIWGTDSASDENLTQAVSRLRAALRIPGQSLRHIKTVPKVGYVFRWPEVSNEAVQDEPISLAAEQTVLPDLMVPVMHRPRPTNTALAAFSLAALFVVFLFFMSTGDNEIVIDYEVEVEVTGADPASSQAAVQPLSSRF